MKRTILTTLSLLFGLTLFAQSTIEEEFETFLKTQLQTNGEYEFESFCIVDTVYIDNIETGELVGKEVKFHPGFSKSDKFNLKINNNLISAPFTSLEYGDKGTVIGKRHYTIEFKQDKDNFEVTNISDSKKSKCKKSGECWEILN